MKNNAQDVTGNSDAQLRAALDEYKEVQQEKRLYIQSSFAVLTVMVAGTVGILTAIIQVNSPQTRIGLALAGQFGQFSLLILFQILSAYSLRHGMYSAVVEERIVRIVGRRVVRWEITTADKYPGRDILGQPGRGEDRRTDRRGARVGRQTLPPKENVTRKKTLGVIDYYLIVLGALLILLLLAECVGVEALIYVGTSAIWRTIWMGSYAVGLVLLTGALSAILISQENWALRLLIEFQGEERLYYADPIPVRGAE